MTVIERTDEIDVDIGGIIDAVRVVAHYNHDMLTLAEAIEQNAPSAALARGKVANEVLAGASLFEALTKSAPLLANALHDFVYFLVAPHDSVTRKDILLEKVIEDVMAL